MKKLNFILDKYFDLIILLLVFLLFLFLFLYNSYHLVFTYGHLLPLAPTDEFMIGKCFAYSFIGFFGSLVSVFALFALKNCHKSSGSPDDNK